MKPNVQLLVFPISNPRGERRYILLQKKTPSRKLLLRGISSTKYPQFIRTVISLSVLQSHLAGLNHPRLFSLNNLDRRKKLINESTEETALD